ncbi:MAG TPA: hypothetical protein VGM51_19480 [Armatimonadota bacterium]
MAFYDKGRKPRPGGDRPESRANDRDNDERNARRAPGPADRRNEDERGRPPWMDKHQDDRDHRSGEHEDRGPRGGGYGDRGPRDRGPREGGYGDRGPQGGGYGDRRPQGGGYGDRGAQSGGYGDRRPQGGGYGDRGPQGGGYGDRPPYDRGPRGGGSGDRPPYDRDRGSRPGGDRPSYGDRPQRPPYGDRPERPARPEPAPAAADEGYSLDELEAMTRRVVREEIKAFFDEQLARQAAEERAMSVSEVETAIADVAEAAEAVLEDIVAAAIEPVPEPPKRASRKKKDTEPEAAEVSPAPEEAAKPKRASRKKAEAAPAEAAAAPEKPKRTRKPKAAE